MNCATHPEVAGTAFCRSCGRALCAACAHNRQGVPYCENCRAADEDLQAAVEPAPSQSAESAIAANIPQAELPAEVRALARSPKRSADTPSPFLALVLGLIPGVGAVYNGHYAKAVFHVVIFGGVVTLIGANTLRGLEPLLVMFAVMFFVYMPIEACRTARALKRGEEVDEFSGLLSLVFAGSQSPAVGITLIALGIVFLLHSLGYWRIESLAPYWPLSLIALGIYMLYRRFSDPPWRDATDYPRRSFEQGPPLSGLGATSNAAEPSAVPHMSDAPAPFSESEPEAVETTKQTDL